MLEVLPRVVLDVVVVLPVLVRVAYIVSWMLSVGGQDLRSRGDSVFSTLHASTSRRCL